MFGLKYFNNAPGRRGPLSDDAACYADWGHLNERGSERFSARLADDLAAVFAERGWRLGPR